MLSFLAAVGILIVALGIAFAINGELPRRYGGRGRPYDPPYRNPHRRPFSNRTPPPDA